LPLAIDGRGLTRRLTWLGQELADYGAPLLAVRFAQSIGSERFGQVWQDVLERLRRRQCFAFDVIHLEKMPETVGGQSNPFIGLDVMPNPNGAYLMHLSGDWGTFYASKPRRARAGAPASSVGD
jgi:CelD/BcsL family acetyltransferase involved in cellulose biosynthesis